MGVQPAPGRFFTTEEGRPNANIPVVVASYGLWQRMGGASDFVGTPLRVNGKPHTVIGIAPAGSPGISALGAHRKQPAPASRIASRQFRHPMLRARASCS